MPGGGHGGGVRERLPLALSLAAVLVAGAGVTPPGQAASRTVRAALFSSDAGAVNGIRASRRPQPGRLLVLDREGRYPRSVIPPTVGEKGPRGVQGPPGPQGAAGRTGGALFFARAPAVQLISRFPHDRRTVAQLADLGPGSWLVLAQLSAGSVGSPADLGCVIARRNVVVGPSRTTIGRGPGGMRATGALAIAGWSSADASTPRLDCGLERESTGEPGIERVWLGAVRVGSLEIRRQGP